MPKATSIRYHETGKPEQVLRVESIDVPEPGSGQALIELRASAINPSDLGMIGGSYGRLRELPAIGGREGVGEVVAVGPDTTTVAPGDIVRMPETSVWSSCCVADAANLTVLPKGLPLEQAAMAFVNPPTALRILSDFGNLHEGDWVMQNAGNSALGFYAAQLCRKFGYKMISVVRDPAKWENKLKDAGAAAVVADNRDYPKELAEITGGDKPKLALNSVGGESVSNLIKCMADGGTVVTFGGMSGDKVRFPTRFLIFNDVHLCGFWMDRWFRKASPEAAKELMDTVYTYIADGTLCGPIDSTYPLENGVEAVAHASQPGRNGKVLITNGL